MVIARAHLWAHMPETALLPPEQRSSSRLGARLAAETIGTYFLVSTISFSAGQQQPLTPLAIGAMLMAMVFSFSHVSGAHFNPAVTLALLVRGRVITCRDAGAHVAAQLAGAFAGAGFGAGVLGASCLEAGCGSGYPLRPATVTPQAALAVEASFTFALATVVLNTATTQAQDGNSFFGLAIGFTVAAGAVAGGGVSGGAFNPAVGTALPVVNGHAADVWLYWLGPCIGAVAAAATFRWLTAPPSEYPPPSGDANAAKLNGGADVELVQ